jgi:hypothetical protein
MQVAEQNLLKEALCQVWPPHEAAKGSFVRNHRANRAKLREAEILLHSGQAGT